MGGDQSNITLRLFLSLLGIDSFTCTLADTPGGSDFKKSQSLKLKYYIIHTALWVKFNCVKFKPFIDWKFYHATLKV